MAFRLDREKIIALCLLLFCALMWFWFIPRFVETEEGGQGVLAMAPDFFPRTATAAIALLTLFRLAALTLIKPGARKKEPDPGFDLPQETRALICFGLSGLYFLGIQWIGFLPSTPLVMFALLSMYEPRRWVYNSLFSLGTTLGVYIFFRFLMQVHFPAGTLME